MNKLLYLVPLFALSIFLTSCSQAPEGKKAQVSEARGTAAAATAGAVTYAVSDNSTVTWTGSKPAGKHMGKLKVSSGAIKVNNGNIEAGSFVIDMKSNEVTDLKAGDGKEDLEGHMANQDFFEVDKYSSGSFTITGVAPVTGNAAVTHNITGDLKLKDKVHSVTFGANVNIGPDKLSAVTPSFTINRTDWGINYKSASLAGAIKDKIINDEVGIVININATK